MTKLRRSMTIRCLFWGVLLLAGTSRAQTRPPIVEQLAKTYGLDSYGQVEAIRYTFNLQLPALKLDLSRSWEWEPKTGKVSYEGKDKDGKPVKVTYLRSQLNTAPANVKDEIDPAFVNDNYWAIFPFHVYWDTSANVVEKDNQKLPIGKGTAKGRHLGSLRRVGWASRAIHLSSRRTQTTEQRHNHLGGLQEGWPSALLDGPSRNGGRQAGANFLHECGRQASGVGHLGGRAIGSARARSGN